MPVVPGPGPPFDVLGNHLENRRGRLCLAVGLLPSLPASALSRSRPRVPSSLSAHGLRVCSADAPERPAAGLRVKPLSLMSEDHWACPRVEDDLLSAMQTWADWLVAESAVQSAA